MDVQSMFDGEAPVSEPTRTELTPAQLLLARVIALAADDCRKVLHQPAFAGETRGELVEAASAVKFFLSPEGRGMILALGLGLEGVRAGTALAHATLRSLGISEAALEDSAAQWCDAIERRDPTRCSRLAANVGQQRHLRLAA